MCWLKVNSIVETLISQALIDMDIISHEEFVTILDEKKKQVWEDERQFKKWKWRIQNYETE